MKCICIFSLTYIIYSPIFDIDFLLHEIINDPDPFGIITEIYLIKINYVIQYPAIE